MSRWAVYPLLILFTWRALAGIYHSMDSGAKGERAFKIGLRAALFLPEKIRFAAKPPRKKKKAPVPPIDDVNNDDMQAIIDGMDAESALAADITASTGAGDVDASYETAIAAIDGNFIDKLELILDSGKVSANASTNKKGEADDPLILNAVGKGRLEMAKLLIARGADIGVVGLSGESALHRACDHPTTTLPYAISKGLDLNAKDADDQTPLDKAAFCDKKFYMESIRLLLQAGADKKQAPFVLSMAAYQRNPDAIKELLENGFPIDARTTGKCDPCNTALGAAVMFGNFEEAKILIEKGASIQIPQVDGRSLIYLAGDRTDDNEAKKAERVKLRTYLRNLGLSEEVTPDYTYVSNDSEREIIRQDLQRRNECSEKVKTGIKVCCNQYCLQISQMPKDWVCDKTMECRDLKRRTDNNTYECFKAMIPSGCDGSHPTIGSVCGCYR